MQRAIAIIIMVTTLSSVSVSWSQTVSAGGASQPSEWAERDIQEAEISGILPQWVEGRYTSKITRVQFAEMILLLYEALTGQRLEGPVSNPFRDTRNFYAAQGVKLGLMNGTSKTTFSPDLLITREQLAVMLYNTMTITNLKGRMKQEALPAFADEEQMASWSQEAIEAMASGGLIQGSVYQNEVYFLPKQTTTIEQAIVLVNRIHKQFGKLKVGTEKALLTAVQYGLTPSITDTRVQTIYEEAHTVLAKIIRPGMSDYEKELAIHDYLVLNTVYDEDNYNQGTVPKDSYSAYGALILGIAVCQGYANAANLMLNLAGIEAHIVTGTVNGEAHAWNKVKLGGEYYNLDVTWDDPVPDIAGRVDYGYFNVTDEELRQDHSWKDSLPEAAATAFNYYVMNGLVAESREEFVDRINRAIGSYDTAITIKRSYTREKNMEELKAIIFSHPIVAGFDCVFGSGGVLTISLRYR
ncbi:hypothetical protein FHS18_004308 [Paenibacillus phyllosphaerae]|uniref:SLH domain-containing protein n=1 Tax=Paenibacillus phyllosphaerae TaxID=274593 RepID=A0A7W5B0N4_9BACL|nr:transglutaminase domain-containing protein [Paenibacillus phyllosphaerae]MBB3112222.1 hypothetical protein [Paenibacillus phyllosphaerae]